MKVRRINWRNEGRFFVMAAIQESLPYPVTCRMIVAALCTFVARPEAEQVVHAAVERLDRGRMIDIDAHGFISTAAFRQPYIPDIYRGHFLIGRSSGAAQ